MPAPIRVLHVDDEEEFLDVAATFLERESDRIEVVTATSTREALGVLEEAEVDCVVSDYDMPNRNGIEFLEAVREEYSNLPFILFTGKGSEEVAADALSAGATEYIQKEVGASQYTVLANRIENSVEQSRARRRSERADRRRRQTLERITDGYVEMDAELTVTEVNDQTLELTGLSRETLLGTKYGDLIEGESNESYEAYRDVLATGEPRTIEARSDINPDRWIEERIFPTEDGDSVFVYFRDITERKERERELRTKTKQLEGVLNSVQAAIWMRNADSEFLLMNQNYRDVFGIDEDVDVTGKTPADLLDPATADQATTHDERVLASGEPVETEEEVDTVDGTRVYLTKITPLFDDGEPFATAGAAVDITERREREQTLTALHSAAQRIEAADDAAAVYETLVDTAENVLEFDLVAVDVERDGYLIQEAWKLERDEAGYYERTSLEDDDTFAVRAYNRQETIVVDDLRETEIAPADPEYRSAITVPLGPFGTFQAVFSEADAVDEYDREFAELLVDHARVKLTQLEER